MAKSKWREFQDEMLNQGWRIQWIPHDDGTQMLWYPTNWLALVGAGGFLGGFGIMFLVPFLGLNRNLGATIGLGTSVGSLGLMFFAIWFKGRRKRRGWAKVTADCVDLERQNLLSQDRASWTARIVCEFEFNGREYRATPIVHYRTFTTEAALNKYLGSRISTDGQCELHVNPKNPLECELANQGIKERLLF